MKKIDLSLRALLVAFGIVFTANNFAQNSLGSVQTLVVATYQYADNPRITNISPYANFITALTGIKTEVKSFPGVHELLSAMEREEVDVVFMNTFGYLMLNEKSSAYEIGAVLNIPELCNPATPNGFSSRCSTPTITNWRWNGR